MHERSHTDMHVLRPMANDAAVARELFFLCFLYSHIAFLLGHSFASTFVMFGETVWPTSRD